MSDDPFRHELFTPLIGSTFRIQFTDGVIDLRLEEVTPLPSPRYLTPSGEVPVPETIQARRNPFTISFRGPRNIQLPQRVYRMTQETFAEPLDIFIVPVGVDAEGYRYQAVFS
jgi:hypothetical protein